MHKILVFVLLLNIGIVYSAEISKGITVTQNKAVLQNNGGFYKIANSPFEISLQGIDAENPVYIVAGFDDSFQKSLKVPSMMKDVSYFLPGTGMAIEINKKDRSIPLLMCGKYSHNHVTEDRRTRQGNDITIKISGIYEIEKKISGSKEIHLIIFADKNKNESVDKDEIAFIKLKI
jgi:hypothetical protein